jgi:hypothetical protein
MKTLPELLREVDPLLYETHQSAEERRTMRQRVLSSPRVEEPPQRRVALAVLTLTLLGAATGGYWSWVAVDVIAAVRFEARLAEETPANGLQEVVIGDARRTIYLHPNPIVTNSDIARAEVRPGDGASPFAVAITFNDGGAAKMLQATQSHIGRPLAILIDGKLVAAPVLRSPITASAVINGNFTEAEADRIVGGMIGR